jgi:hypothetical protein
VSGQLNLCSVNDPPSKVATRRSAAGLASIEVGAFFGPVSVGQLSVFFGFILGGGLRVAIIGFSKAGFTQMTLDHFHGSGILPSERVISVGTKPLIYKHLKIPMTVYSSGEPDPVQVLITNTS